ncbi:nose resistant to fluoxetine protein 6-like [Linepithema humile]|uniref:nose resistant to fluoxetine protein 6-like n=1 Tax=Linepithema humile TaxID=83485 RepID=UPI00062358DA|nr:PREDICTED: nose resistant to fluoxetine protein 6-like [Linepithema humile]XP_012225931.1 PREDICTED: nose resistant to fluoxetine protein 6-like [Linepithema humile]
MSHWQVAFTLCICVNFSALICVSTQIHGFNENNGSNYTLPAYAIASKANLLNSTCGKELHDFRDAIDQRILWSLKMLDSSGEPKSGFLYGNNYWLGSRSQCYDTMNKYPFELSKRNLLNNSLYRDRQKEYPPFKINYFVAHFKHNSTLQYHVELPNEDLIVLGLCLPASCSINDLSVILERIFQDRLLLIGNLYAMDFRLIEVKDLKDDHQWLFSGAIPLISVILMLTICAMIIGTIYDVFVHQKHLNAKNKTHKKNIHEQMEITTLPSHQENKLGKILMCFSIYTNTKIILSMKVEGDSIPIIYGLKLISTIWIISIHIAFFSIDYIDNKIWALRLSASLPSQVFTSATLAVETFLFLSGFLMTYSYLKHEKGQEKTIPIPYKAKLNKFFFLIIKRFIRLTPAYMMMIGITQLNWFWYDKTSQFYMSDKLHELCAKYWWRNLLYINNLFDYSTMCMSWTWYLAIDMQFYIISVGLLILSTMYFYIAVVILGILLIGTIVFSGYISYAYEYVPTFDEMFRLANVLYLPSWIRISSYLVGIITGYILVKLNKKLSLNKQILILCWFLGITCNISVLFGLYKRQISVLSSAIYIALSKSAWTIGIGWIVIACSTKNGGIIEKILSFRGFIPLSKLTYCAYLIHPFVIQSVNLYAETASHAEIPYLVNRFFGYVVMSFGCSYILTLMAEMPYILLMQMYTQSRGGKKHREFEIAVSHTKL